MEEITNSQINRYIGKIFQKYRMKYSFTQEQLADKLCKSSKTISQIETGKDGTSKKTDIEYMNLLGITPNVLYKDFVTNPEVIRKIEIGEKINNLSPKKVDAVLRIIDEIDKL